MKRHLQCRRMAFFARVLFDNELMAQSMSRGDGLHWLISMQSFFLYKINKNQEIMNVQ